MIPYFYRLKEDIFSDELKEYVVKNSLENVNKFVAYAGTKSNLVDGNNYYYGPMINEHPEVKKIKDSCTLSCFAIVMLHKPYTKVLKHVDDPNKRNCVLATPLYPKENYAPTWFWKPEGEFVDWQKKELELLATCEFSDMKPVFLNTQEIHSLQSTHDYRINLQLCFDEPFDFVVKKYQEGTLFIK